MQVFAAVTQEMQVENAILAEEIVKQNPSLHEALLAELTALGQRQGNTISVRYISHQAFKAQNRELQPGGDPQRRVFALRERDPVRRRNF